MIALARSGMDVTPGITRRRHYAEFEAGFEPMISGNAGKVVLDRANNRGARAFPSRRFVVRIRK